MKSDYQHQTGLKKSHRSH